MQSLPNIIAFPVQPSPLLPPMPPACHPHAHPTLTCTACTAAVVLAVVIAFILAWGLLARQALKDHTQLPYSRYRCPCCRTFPACAGVCGCASNAAAFRALPATQLASCCLQPMPPAGGCNYLPGCCSLPSACVRCPPAPTPRPSAACRHTHIYVRVQARLVSPVLFAVVVSVLLLDMVPALRGNCASSFITSLGNLPVQLSMTVAAAVLAIL